MCKIIIYLFLFFLDFSIVYGQKEPLDYVNCFVGTSNSRWMLGPYAQVPFGMIQIGPDNQGDKWMGGYEYAINSVSHFSHIHAWTMGGLSIMPATIDLTLQNPGPDSPYKGANAGYHSRILKESEQALPGYYSVELFDHNVKAEMTATTHCSFQKYTFPECDNSRFIFKLQFPTEWDYGFTVEDAKVTKVSLNEIEGYAKCNSGNWAKWNDYTIHFVIRFDKSFRDIYGIKNSETIPFDYCIQGNGDIGFYIEFPTKEDEIIKVQTSISLVDIEGARNNLKQEMDIFDWSFSKCMESAQNRWRKILNTIIIEDENEINKEKFYTNLYRAYCGKQTWNDVDGRYVDADEVVRCVPEGYSMYGGDCFWNTYWNLNGLWSLITPKIIDNWVTTQLEMFKYTGWTSKGSTGIEYSGIMEGSHEIALMVSAYQKGIRKDGEEIYKAVKTMVSRDGDTLDNKGIVGQINLSYYDRLGYMPMEIDVVSKTLDYAFDDFCVAQLAEALNYNSDKDFFSSRAMNYKNVFHPDYKYVVPKDSTGKWMDSFDVFSSIGFIEGNSWQYSWYVPHDVNGVVEIMGGNEIASKRLEDGFKKSKKYNYAAHAFDRTWGQRAEYYINHGNEINMCAPFLFNYMGKPWLCQKYCKEILDNYYGNSSYHGWEGDEDEGQMGAWFVMTSLGLFEMNGGVTQKPYMDLTSPLFKKVTIMLDSKYYKGKKFIIEKKNSSNNNIYIKDIYLNGKKINDYRISFKDIVDGGHLIFYMTNLPAIKDDY